ncbi:MAG TPA: phosphoribosylanthranilate isomerase [Gemmatimonadaceae bacterium]|nr:phosphoribosylanthranilate isomerase [Gemmatimonadaceae bacterium]
MAEIKFCGMTRPQDASYAAMLGARYVGIIFADGPRTLTRERAQVITDGLPRRVSRVGVFGRQSPNEIAETAERLELDVVQLHGDPDAGAIADVRARWSGRVWAVQRVSGRDLPPGARDLFDVADAVVLDARVDGRLGGTGVALPWSELAPQLVTLRSRRAQFVLAGGLKPDNVSQAIEALQPDVVDVSSGVEDGVGIKDHERMRAFRDAVEQTSRS